MCVHLSTTLSSVDMYLRITYPYAIQMLDGWDMEKEEEAYVEHSLYIICILNTCFSHSLIHVCSIHRVFLILPVRFKEFAEMKA